MKTRYQHTVILKESDRSPSVYFVSLINKMGKVSKRPPKYERMVAWDGQRNARDEVTVRVGQLDVIKGDVRAVDMSGVLINCLCISRVPSGDACFDGLYWDRAAPVSHVRYNHRKLAIRDQINIVLSQLQNTHELSG